MTDETDSRDERRTEREAGSPAGHSDSDEPGADPLADEVHEEAERLTRLVRDAVIDAEAEAYREERAALLADYDYTARVREDDTRDVLVLHPEEWVEDGTIRPGRIDDIDRGVEIPLSGPGETDDWELLDEHNRELAREVRADHGEAHGANVEALADFASNHYSKPIEDATRGELEEFLSEYYPRNVWPTDEQRRVVEKSVELAFLAAGERCPIEPSR